MTAFYERNTKTPKYIDLGVILSFTVDFILLLIYNGVRNLKYKLKVDL